MESVICNIAVGTPESWYHTGQKRLLESLNDSSYKLFRSYNTPKLNSVYEDKIDIVKTAAYLGYRYILYLDCSITAIRPLDDIWDYIRENGYYLYESGANCSETCNDHSLQCYGVTRDMAESFPECASNVVGIDMKSVSGINFFDLWTRSLNDGSNLGVKWPTVKQRRLESMDKRFKYHRQDQSTASLSAGILGLKLEKHNHFVFRAESDQPMNESVIFKLKGGE